MSTTGTEPQWMKCLLESLKSNPLPESTFLQLASVGADNTPNVRTVVFRGFEQQLLSFTTDLRSDKVKDFQIQPIVECCWYFTSTREQYRIKGKVLVCDGNDNDEKLNISRMECWNRLSVFTKAQFESATPGQIQDEKEQIRGDPLNNFGFCLLNPTNVDYVSLKLMKREKNILHNGEWIINTVNM
eukprot:NODE_8370_length_685_cov_25.918149_g7748_i0.p1 GENE.NODE_8370_length_685_cov_25.918149_g7748_i0~~NODE_8370_length_685_cov_25.918149_g7748_i0.p1  ORF type:complete len:186 (-),score=40.93 NODE_8370_length_685_cov_25.918149_g7748_i0:48-605(-)